MAFWRKKKVFPYSIDLKKTIYLGFSSLSYFDPSTQEVWANGAVYLFCDVKDQNKRFYEIVTRRGDHDTFLVHPFILNRVIPWTLGDNLLWSAVTNPSDELKVYMHEEYEVIWNKDSKKWEEVLKSAEPSPDMLIVGYKNES